MKIKENQKMLLALILIFLIVGYLTITHFYKTYFLPLPTSTKKVTPQSKISVPTLTQQQKEIVSKTQTNQVIIENKKFSPISLQIKVHDQVEWLNKDTVLHQIKGDSWNGPPLGLGESFTQAFDQAGTFYYFCLIHPEMKGTIEVVE